MKSRPSPSLIALTASLLVVFAIGCSEDDPKTPTSPPDGSGGSGPSVSSSGGGGNGDDPDAGDDAGTDAEQDVGGDADTFVCDLEPSDFPADPTRPCCFHDRDCRDSDAPQADEMYCYHADCGSGIQGVCRVPPAQEGDCWDKWDCQNDQICPYEMDPDNLDCELYTDDTPDLCIDGR